MELLKIGQEGSMDPYKWSVVVGVALLTILILQSLVSGSKLIPPILVAMVSYSNKISKKLIFSSRLGDPKS